MTREETKMSSLLRVALLLALSCLPSKADEQDVNRQDMTKNIGRGLLCDTSQQAERFVTLRNDGKEVEVALQNVNEEAHKSNACGIALVVFTGGEGDAAGVGLVRLFVDILQ